MKKAFLLLIISLPLLLSAVEYRVGDHELLTVPTAYVMPKGDSYFTDYELILINYVYSVGYNTHLAAFSLFPITTDFIETVSFGIKNNYYRKGSFASSLVTSYTPKTQLFSGGNVISVGSDPSNSAHLGTLVVKSGYMESAEILIFLGYRYDLSKNVSLMTEYLNVSAAVEEDFNGMLSFGFRVRSGNLAWELAGIRPLEDMGNIFMIPLLKATYYFKN
jgi:hypothetical protein